jgi:hypothetical protein
VPRLRIFGAVTPHSIRLHAVIINASSWCGTLLSAGENLLYHLSVDTKVIKGLRGEKI